MDFVSVLLGYRCEHLLPEVDACPGCSVIVLSSHPDHRARARWGMLQHLRVLFEVEKLAHSHAGLRKILDAVCWKDWALVRSLLFTNEREKGSVGGQSTIYFLPGIL